MKIPQTIEMQVGALNTSEHNPRQITEDDFAELVKSLLLLPKGLYYRPSSWTTGISPLPGICACGR